MISSAKFGCKLQSSVLWGFSGTILFNDFIADLRDGTGVHYQQVCEWPETGGVIVYLLESRAVVQGDLDRLEK